MRRAVILLVALPVLAIPSAQAAESPDRVVIFGLPGVTWDDILTSSTPAFDAVMAEGAGGSLAVRVASTRSTTDAAYASLGAGNRAHTRIDEEAHLAFGADETPFGDVTAGEALEARVGPHRPGSIVHLGIAGLHNLQATQLHAAEVGAMGEALASSGIDRAIVSAADLAVEARSTSTLRRAATLSVVDAKGVVDHGTFDGMIVADPSAAFGVRTSRSPFEQAVANALARARVIAIDPGDTSRAAEFEPMATPEQASVLRREALESSDQLLDAVRSMLTPRDLLIVIGLPGPLRETLEHLSPIATAGPGLEGGWLVSPTTRRPGLVALTDVGPTVLDVLGIERPDAMTGRPFSAVGDRGQERMYAFASMDTQAAFRETFSAAVFYIYVGLLVAVALLSFIVFLGQTGALRRSLLTISYIILAAPPATLLLRAVGAWRWGDVGAHLALWMLAAALATAAWRVPGPRWAGGVALMLVHTAMVTVDLLTGGYLQVNAVFGNSLLAAGRFYGISNTGFSALLGAGILGLTGLADLRGNRRGPWWLAGGMLALVLVIGLPPFGANLGGMITAGAAAGITFLLARTGYIRWRTLLLALGAAVAVTALVAFLDLLRPTDSQTHLGRFAAMIISGEGALTVMRRKALQSLSTLGFTRWTYAIPVAVAVVAVLLHRPRGVLRSVIPQHPMLRAGLWGCLAGGVVGFAVNDSGIAVPAMIVAHAVPLLVLIGVDTISPRIRVAVPRAATSSVTEAVDT